MNSIRLKKETLSTQAFEQRMEQIKQDIVRYRNVEKSAELKEWNELRPNVEAADFQANKKLLLTRKYRDTEEGKTMAAYRSVARSLAVRYWLKHQNEGEQYTEESKGLRVKWFRSAAANPKVAEYKTLKATVDDKEWQERHAFWKNPKRWYTTPESKLDARYEELKKMPDIVFFLQSDEKQIARWESYKTVWADECDQKSRQQSAWKPGFHYASKALKSNHSLYNEQQAYNDGKNTTIVGSALTVETRKESVQAAAWHPVKGFVQKEYLWTSDHLQLGDTLRVTKGTILAKVKVDGPAQQALYLTADEQLPLVEMLHWDGKKASMGLRTSKANQLVYVDGLAKNKWYIVGVVIDKKEIVWTVNGQEIMHTENTLQGKELFPVLTAFVPEGQKAGKSTISIDWMSVYTTED